MVLVSVMASVPMTKRMESRVNCCTIIYWV